MKQFSKNSRGAVSNKVSFVILLVWLALIGLAIGQRQQIFDWWRLRDYTPPTAISQLAADTTMTAGTKRIFFVNHPLIEDKSNFTTQCPNHGGEKTIILGCYHGGQSGIYLLNVTDARLQGVEQVTAAHEMLHAAYDRLSSKERRRIDGLLTDFYKTGLQDQRIKDVVDAYKQSEPNDVVNEMHSIFGTEVASLPPALESYYQRYFENRAKVVAYASQYEGEFTSRKVAIQQADSQLVALKTRIEEGEKTLKAEQDELSSRQQSLAALQRSGDAASYNASVPAYNRLVDQYNAQVRLIQSLVAQYNALVASRNAIASEITELSNALSTSATQIQQ